MKRIFKKKSFWIVLAIVVIVIIIIVSVSGGDQKIEYTTQEAKFGKLIQTVTATGVVESANEIDLNFNTAGRLVILNANEGEEVNFDVEEGERGAKAINVSRL